MSSYRHFIIQTYENYGEPSNKRIRARALPGQGVATDRKVECSEEMRLSHPVGSCFKVECKITNRDGGTPFLYRHHSWPYELLTQEESEDFIQKNFPN
mgnify:CR=1 FL=1